jgi:hypothetical protein
MSIALAFEAKFGKLTVEGATYLLGAISNLKDCSLDRLNSENWFSNIQKILGV